MGLAGTKSSLTIRHLVKQNPVGFTPLNQFSNNNCFWEYCYVAFFIHLIAHSLFLLNLLMIFILDYSIGMVFAFSKC